MIEAKLVGWVGGAEPFSGGEANFLMYPWQYDSNLLQKKPWCISGDMYVFTQPYICDQL